jgi:predicted ribosome quality control (RQC) complex YloA/Tae2 family protein
MDNALLVPVVTELRDRLTGATLGDAVQIDSRRFALRFSVPPFLRVGITLHPELSSLHLVKRVSTPREPTDLSVALTEHLGGLPLREMRKAERERVVEMEFGGDRGRRGTLVLELMGKSSNLILLDPQRRVLKFLRSHKGGFRQPRPGEEYEPPPERPEDPALPLGSRLLGRETAERISRGGEESTVLAELISRMREGPWDPCLYTPAPPDAMGESADLRPWTCFAAPFPLVVGERLLRTPFDTMAGAAGGHAAVVQRHLLFRDLRGSLLSLVRGEVKRLRRLETTLEREAGAARGAEEVRRLGELLLASMATARKEGGHVEVTDVYHPGARKIRIDIDPALNLKANVEAFFRRARKMERAVGAIASRRRDTAGKLAGLEEYSLRLEGSATTAELERVEEELSRSGLVRMIRRPAKRQLGRKPSFMRVKEYRTSDGHTVLVGGSSADNDILTFKVAAPHDFWLHAAGRPGAHVVVRNPHRQRELPRTALMEAAAMAAWFSRGDRETDVDVHVTRRKEVRKGKGMSPGMVVLRSFRTVRVRPAPPPEGPSVLPEGKGEP